MELREIFQQVADGTLSVDDAVLQYKMAPFEDLGFAKLDHHRSVRQGVAEVIYGAGKTPEQIRAIAAALRESGQKTVLITRMSREAAELAGQDLPLSYHEMGRVGIVGELPEPTGKEKSSLPPAAPATWPLPRRRRSPPRPWETRWFGSMTWGWPGSTGSCPTAGRS